MPVTGNAVGPSQLGGFLNPMAKDFGLRVNAINGGYLINNFAGGMAVRTTLEEAKQFVMDAFDTAFAPQSTDEQTPAEETSTAAANPAKEATNTETLPAA